MCKERIKCRKKDVLGNLDMKLEELIQMPNNLDEKVVSYNLWEIEVGIIKLMLKNTFNTIT